MTAYGRPAAAKRAAHAMRSSRRRHDISSSPALRRAIKPQSPKVGNRERILRFDRRADWIQGPAGAAPLI
jgi:hypothetical protein